MTRKSYVIEAWRGVEAVGFTTRSRPDVVIREADAYVVDKGADRVYVRAEHLGKVLVGERDGWGWKRMDDPALEAVLVEQGQIDPPRCEADSIVGQCDQPAGHYPTSGHQTDGLRWSTVPGPDTAEANREGMALRRRKG